MNANHGQYEGCTPPVPVEAPTCLTDVLETTYANLREIGEVIAEIENKLYAANSPEGDCGEKGAPTPRPGIFEQAEINAERANLILNEIINLRDIL